MCIRDSNKTKLEVSIDEPLNVDWDGNELLLSDILGTEEDTIYRDLETEAEQKMLRKAIEKLSPREKMCIRDRSGEIRKSMRKVIKHCRDFMQSVPEDFLDGEWETVYRNSDLFRRHRMT